MRYRWVWQNKINENLMSSIDAHSDRIKLLGERVKSLEESRKDPTPSRADPQLLLDEASRLLDMAQVMGTYGAPEQWMEDYESWSDELRQRNERVGWTREKGFR